MLSSIRIPAATLPGLVCLLGMLALEPARGDLRFANKEFVYNASPEEDEFKATYVYENTGTRNIAITQIKTFCGCLTASVDKPLVKPGEKGTLTGVFTIGKITGSLTKQIEVTTNLPSNGVKMLDVTLNVPELVKITPEKGLKWLLGEDPVAKTIQIEVLSEDPIHIKSITSSRKNVAAALKTIEEGRKYEIVVQPTSTKDVTLGYLKIVTDCKYEKHRNQMAFFTIMKEGPAR